MRFDYPNMRFCDKTQVFTFLVEKRVNERFCRLNTLFAITTFHILIHLFLLIFSSPDNPQKHLGPLRQGGWTRGAQWGHMRLKWGQNGSPRPVLRYYFSYKNVNFERAPRAFNGLLQFFARKQFILSFDGRVHCYKREVGNFDELLGILGHAFNHIQGPVQM